MALMEQRGNGEMLIIKHVLICVCAEPGRFSSSCAVQRQTLH